MSGAIFGPGNICAGPVASLAGRQEALLALPNQNDDGTAGLRSRTCADPARDEKGPGIFILSLAQDTSEEARCTFLSRDLSLVGCWAIPFRTEDSADVEEMVVTFMDLGGKKQAERNVPLAKPYLPSKVFISKCTD